VLGIATVLGVVGPVAAFGLFFLGDRVFHLDRPHLQPMMYLMLSVAGHLTIFLTRTRGPFWSIRPARILWIAVLGTQILATLIAVYGVFMPPLGWGWALFVWGYALAWFLVTDPLKLLAYRILDPAEAKIDPPKTEIDPPKAKTPTDLTPEIATRAYELYEQEGHRDGHAVEDWGKAEGEIRKNEPQGQISNKPKRS
jgi:H+-transporting ATPase